MPYLQRITAGIKSPHSDNLEGTVPYNSATACHVRTPHTSWCCRMNSHPPDDVYVRLKLSTAAVGAPCCCPPSARPVLVASASLAWSWWGSSGGGAWPVHVVVHVWWRCVVGLVSAVSGWLARPFVVRHSFVVCSIVGAVLIVCLLQDVATPRIRARQGALQQGGRTSLSRLRTGGFVST